jgi:hypothetical protein
MINAAVRLPPVERLLEVLSYSPETGLFTWEVNKSRSAKIGTVAGTKDTRGYIRIRVDGVDYRAHILAWFAHYNLRPGGEIDHINRDKTDNRISNLRVVNRRENILNRGMQKNNTSGHTGVYWRKESKKWTTSYTVSKKQIHIGYFVNVEEAVAARAAALSLIKEDM